MRNFTFGILTIVLLLLGAYGTHRAYTWKQHTDQRTYWAAEAASYLFTRSGALTPDGAPVSRQQLLDAFLQEYAKSKGLKFEK